MKAVPLKIPDAFLVGAQRSEDGRGRFTTFWESAEIYDGGLRFSPQSAHHASSDRAGTLRGMHYQREPHAQAKLVACAAGRVRDVLVDLRRDSPAYLRWEAVTLDESDGRALFVPRGCAHGYLTLADRSTVTYLIEGAYLPEASAVVRWNDPAIGIEWPIPDPILSERDRTAPDYLP
jgi:dTDP-4-dehydrorhamnose 3,5-epimerase